MSQPSTINNYDSRNYTRKGLNRRVVVREKPLIKSRTQRLIAYLRPTMRYGFDTIQPFEIFKVMGCIIFPVFMLMYWKYRQKDLPDNWERQFGGLQHRQFRDDQLPEQETDYFSIMNTFEERREKALEKKRQEVLKNKLMKRARSSSQSSRGSVDTQPAVANAVDAELEAQLGRLDIDDDFKDSIRAMTPDTRREVMNDIVRNQAAAAIDVPPHLVFNGAQEGHPMHFAMEHVMADDDDDNDGFGNDRDDVAQQQGGGFDFAQFLMALLTERGVAVNGRADPHNGFLNVLTNISNQVQQHRIMQEMGITEEDMDNMSYEDLLALEERIGNISKGLRPEQMKRTYTVAKASSKPRDERCAVCQEEWSENTAHKRVELNSCHHEFHEDCICTWLASNKTCPICKQEVI